MSESDTGKKACVKKTGALAANNTTNEDEDDTTDEVEEDGIEDGTAAVASDSPVRFLDIAPAVDPNVTPASLQPQRHCVATTDPSHLGASDPSQLNSPPVV